MANTSPPSEPEAPITSAIKELQETAKWLITIFGAVAGVLVAGIQLSGLGELRWNEPRLWIAIAAGAVGLFCVGLIIFFATRVLTGGFVTRTSFQNSFTSYRDPSKWHLHVSDCVKLEEMLNTFGYEKIDDLLKEYDEAIKERKGILEDAGKPDWKQENEQQLENLNGKIAYLGDLIGQLTTAARYNTLCKHFKIAVRILFSAGFIGALSIGTFAWAVNPPKSTPEPSATETKTATPSVSETVTTAPAVIETDTATAPATGSSTTVPLAPETVSAVSSP